MRASLNAVAEGLGSSRVPAEIRQEPFDYDPGHYARICSLDGNRPNAGDLIDYSMDMTYMELQPDLLRHLLPVLLEAWRIDLFEGDGAGYTGFVAYFWPALLQVKVLSKGLTETEWTLINRFIRDTILDRLDAETSLSFSGMGASPYQWIYALGAFGVVFDDIESLWIEWWRTKTQGHAVAAFQYASALLYEKDKNPVFAPWTRDKGGGPPCLWECGCHIYHKGWQEENIQFVRRTLSAEYIGERLQAADNMIVDAKPKSTATRILADLPDQSALLSLRTEELPVRLREMEARNEFTI